MNRSATWTDETVAELRQYWAEGISCGLIAKKFGTTRNAIIGKVHRLDLPARKTLVKDVRQQDRRYKPGGTRYRQHVTHRVGITRRGSGYHAYTRKIKSQDAPVIPRPTEIPEPVSLNLTLMDIGPRQCRWAHGDGPFLFCGAPTDDGRSYCPHHYARTVQPEWRTSAMRRRDARDNARTWWNWR